MFEIPGMFPEPFFEWCFRSLNISFAFTVGIIRDFCFTTQKMKKSLRENYIFWATFWCKTFIAQRTLISNRAIESKIFFAEIQYLFVVYRNKRYHVFHTKVTYFNCITVEYFAHSMSLWEVTP